jgi:tetratricopeptide (TPR) repeat protein
VSDSAPKAPAGSPAGEASGRVGRYEVRTLLGRGAMGVVYRAYDTVLEREVALKLMGANMGDDPGVYERFVREAKAVAKMTHPNVVMVFDLGSHTDGSPYIAMELLNGQDLAKALRAVPPLPLDQKLGVVLQVLAGLGHAHKAAIVHRDIKPANIFLSLDGTAKIMDFGIARLTTASLTGTGTIVGTADYMSPEQVQGAKVDGRSDVFSMGCVLYELLTGQRPFHADELMAIFYRITHKEPDYAPVTESALLPVLKRALSKDLAHRYQSAEEFAAELRAAMTRLALRPTTTLPNMAHAPTMAGDPTPTWREKRAARTAARAAASGTHVVGGETAPSAWPKYAGLGALALLVAAGAFYFLRPDVVPAASTAPPIASTAPGVVPSASALPAVMVPSAAPPPTFGVAEGPGAAAMRTAQAAFKSGDYAKAGEQARAALASDPASVPARALLDKASAGQRALTRLAAGETALRSGNLPQALSEAQAAYNDAPWDRRPSDLLSRVKEAEQRLQAETQQKAQAAAAAQLNGFLTQAEAALSAGNYDDAIAGFDRALALDPANERANRGKSGTITAQAIAKAARSAPAAGTAAAASRFTPGRTVPHPAEAAAGGAPAGFESTPSVTVKKGSQAAELPGKILFEVEPAAVSPGAAYTVRIFLHNDGSAPIPVKDMVVGTQLNGRTARGPLPPLAREVAPGQKALLREVSAQWKSDTTSWAMEVLVRTTRGDAYENKLSWK